MRFCAELKDKESKEYQYYQKFLERQKMVGDKTDADDVADYFKGRYKLYSTAYTNEEISALIRLYYEMERVGFGAYQSYTIASGINKELVARLEERNIEGVNFKIEAGRVYTYPGVASHILGRLGKITAENAEYYLELGYSLDALVGKDGCEELYEAQLRATDGVVRVRYDENGKMVEKTYISEPSDGKDVYLTIDIELQIAAESALEENVKNIESSDAGAVTVIDPNSGDLLATASYPTYDLSMFESIAYYNSLQENEHLPLFNRALNGVYAPGSTYKIGVAMAALESGVLSEDTLCDCTRVYHTGHTCLDSHGELNVVGAIRESCNVFFYTLGEAMGIEEVTKYTERLGLGKETGLELPNKSGIVAGPAYRAQAGGSAWMLGDDLNASIGQSDHGYTPLQMSVYMSSVVNGGTRYKVNLLKEVREQYSDTVVSNTSPEALDKVEFSDGTYDLLIEAMRQVVSENPVLRDNYLRDVPVVVGGKTGTSQVAGKRDYAVFCGFAPLDEPKIVISCVIEEGVYGQRAAYAVGKIMEKYFELYGEEIS